jgi:hypothetical protein
MANVLEATVDAVKSTTGDVAGAARHGVEALGEQVSSLASKVTDLIEPPPKSSRKSWWFGALLLVVIALGLVWWRHRAASTVDDTERTDASGAPRQPLRTSA